MNKIKNILENNKKKLVVVVLLLLAITLSTGYILTNKKADVKPTSNKTSEVTTKEDNKSDKKTEVKTDKKSDEKKDEVKEDKKEDKKVETTVEETKTTEVTDTTTSSDVSNNTSTNKNTVSDNGCKTVYHEAVTHNVYHEAVTQQVWVVDTPAHDETTYTLVYYVQFSNGEKWYQDGSADFANRVADYTASNGLSYSVRAENQPNTTHYDEVGHYETQVVSQAWTETVVDTPAYTTCE